jgi:hypothetical protein
MKPEWHAAELNRWTVIDSRWNKYDVSRESFVELNCCWSTSFIASNITGCNITSRYPDVHFLCRPSVDSFDVSPIAFKLLAKSWYGRWGSSQTVFDARSWKLDLVLLLGLRWKVPSISNRFRVTPSVMAFCYSSGKWQRECHRSGMPPCDGRTMVSCKCLIHVDLLSVHLFGSYYRN